MEGDSGATTAAVSTEGRSSRAQNTASALIILARTVLALIVISLLAVTFPFQPWSPEWYLRLSQLLIDYSPVLLLALALLLLVGAFESNSKRSTKQRMLARQISSICLVVYLGLVPLQLLSFGWLWIDSDSQVRTAVGSAEARLGDLRNRIRAAENEGDLRAALGNGQAPSPSAPGLPPLNERKRAIEGAIDRDLLQLRSKLNQERMQRIGMMLASTLRGIAGSVAMAAGMLALRKLI